MKVIVRKTAAQPNPAAKTPEWQDYIPGVDNGNLSLPIEYEIEGTADELPKEGKSFRVMRNKRNGIAIGGIFATSIIQKVYGGPRVYQVETLNSLYHVEVFDSNTKE